MGQYNVTTTNRYAIIDSLGKKSLVVTNDIYCRSTKEVIEVFIKEADGSKRGCFVVTYYTDSIAKDIERNGWRFSFCTKGSYKIKSCQYPSSFNFSILGIMPNGQHFEKRFDYDYCEIDPYFVAREIFRLITEISSCATLEDFEIFQSLTFSKISSFQELVKACNAVEKASTKLSIMKPDEDGTPFYLQLKQKIEEAFTQIKESIAHFQPFV